MHPFGWHGLHPHSIEADETIDDGVYGKGCRSMYLQFAADVPSVGHDRIDRDEERLCYFLVAQPFHYLYYNLLFSLAQLTDRRTLG